MQGDERMPLKRACARCGKAVDGPCPDCTRVRQRYSDAQRGTSTQRGYTPAWRDLRVHALTRDRFTCVDCGWKPDIVEHYERIGIPDLPPTNLILEELRQRKVRKQRHLHGDHIKRVEERRDLVLDIDNVACRCNVCHSKRHAGEGLHFRGERQE